MLLRRALSHLQFAAVILTTSIGFGRSQTLKIWPDENRGNGVTYGADVKLTMWRITNKNAVDAVNARFANDLKMDLVRVPMVARWGATDNKHYDVRDYAIDAKNKGMDVFLSVANTNGSFKSNGDLDDAHQVNKFASWMLCNGCNNPSTVYQGDINLDHYRNWMTRLLDERIGDSNVDYMGPWNEDAATSSDYINLYVGKMIIGVEKKMLEGAATRYTNIASDFAIDVAGSHQYAANDSNHPNLKDAYGLWDSFANAGNLPEWFTETTLYGFSTASGVAHMLPAISAGIEKMIIYQAVPRLIQDDGSDGQHYAATKRLIDYSKGKGAALRVETDNENGIIAAFKDGTDLHVHLCNVDSSTRTMFINIENGYTINSVSKQAYNGSVNTSVKNGGAQIEVTIPGQTYVHITANGLSASGPPAPTPSPPPPPPPPPPPTSSPPAPPSSTYKFIVHKPSDRRVYGEAGASVEVSTAGSSPSDSSVQWEVEIKTGDYIFLNHRASGQRLHCEDDTHLELRDASNRKTQWKLVDAGEGWVRVESRKWGKWLHVSTDGSNFELKDQSSNGENTKWKLVGAA